VTALDAVVALVAALAACVQTAVGMGFALVLSPVLLLATAPRPAILVLTALGLTVNLITLLRGGHRLQVAWKEVAPIVLAAVPGSLGGLLVLQALSKPAIQTAVGAMVVVLALARLAQFEPEVSGPVRPARLVVGALAGVLSTASGINGPPLAIWLAQQRLSATAIRDSLALIFLATGVITTLTLLPGIGDTRLPWGLAGLGLLAVLAGQQAGSHIHLRASAEQLRRALSLIILLTGIVALLSGLGVL
jgi:uncharacterized membrane protein YfcA